MPSDSNNNQDSPSASGRRRSSFVDLFASRPVMPQPNAPRRLSITTMGLSTANNQSSTPYSALRGRTESISSANSNSVDESPFEDEPSATFSPTTATSPFARRMSFGAKALNGNPRSAAGGSSPQAGQNEGFDFAENMRQRAERGSLSSASSNFAQLNPSPPHQRSKSIASVETAPRELPKQQKGPDAFQERILKGDFYMD